MTAEGMAGFALLAAIFAPLALMAGWAGTLDRYRREDAADTDRRWKAASAATCPMCAADRLQVTLTPKADNLTGHVYGAKCDRCGYEPSWAEFDDMMPPYRLMAKRLGYVEAIRHLFSDAV